MRPKTIDAARNKWAGILVRMGIAEKFLRTSTAHARYAGGVTVSGLTTRTATGRGFAASAGAATGSCSSWHGRGGTSGLPRKKLI